MHMLNHMCWWWYEKYEEISGKSYRFLYTSTWIPIISERIPELSWGMWTHISTPGIISTFTTCSESQYCNLRSLSSAALRIFLVNYKNLYTNLSKNVQKSTKFSQNFLRIFHFVTNIGVSSFPHGKFQTYFFTRISERIPTVTEDASAEPDMSNSNSARSWRKWSRISSTYQNCVEIYSVENSPSMEKYELTAVLWNFTFALGMYDNFSTISSWSPTGVVDRMHIRPHRFCLFQCEHRFFALEHPFSYFHIWDQSER